MFAKLLVLTVFCLNLVLCSICATGDEKTCNVIDKGPIITEETISKILIEEESSVNFSFTKGILNFNNFTKGVTGNFTKDEEDILENEKGLWL